MNLTPLSENATFHSASKLRVLRILSLVQIVYERSSQTKLIFQAFVRCLPLLFAGFVCVIFLFSWIGVMMIKAYKEDEYYCDNAFKAVRTMQECFESGGDWIKHKLNFSSLGTTMFFGIAVCSMEGWVYKVATLMDANGKGNAPRYNANEHIQIYFLALFLTGGIIAVTFIVITVLVNYKQTKEELSGERDLTPTEKQWLGIKTYILSLQNEKPKRLPANRFRRLCHQIVTHKAYKLLQGALLVLFLMTSALYRVDLEAETKSLYWKGNGAYLILGVLFDYSINLVAFGCESKNKKGFVLDTCICLFILAGYAVQESDSMLEDRSTESLIFSSLIVFLVPIRHLKRKSASI